MQGQPGFAVQHPNPYAQPVHDPYGQPAYQPAYQPPAQYGAPVVVVVGGQQQVDTTDHAAVNQIDSHLSSGCYSCYNCWLYIVAICGLLSGLSLLSGSQYIVQFLFGFASLFYAINMIAALKEKDPKKASTGLCWAVILTILNGVNLFSQSVYLENHGGTKDEVAIYKYGIAPSVIVDFLIIIWPAFKVKGHLDKRTAILLGTHTA